VVDDEQEKEEPATMAGKDLDALATGLAEERISRGSALKRMGAVLLGGLLASLPMAAAWADPPCRLPRCPGNRICEYFPEQGRSEKLCECCKGNEFCDPDRGCRRR
jgi:hypothetical protein